MAGKRLQPIHPGEILEEEFLRTLGLSANSLARQIDVPVTRISEIVRGRRGITADTALRLARLFGTSAELWLGLQNEYDLRMARDEVGDSLTRRIVPMKRTPGIYDEVQSPASRLMERGEGYARTADRRRVRRRKS
jgi:addiction module HigA family antidote